MARIRVIMVYTIHMKGLKGNKRRGTHTTAIGLAEKLVAMIRHMDGFESVQFGEIKTGGRPNGERRLKATPCPAGIALQIKEGSAVQRVVLYTKSPDVLIQSLKEACADLHIILKDES